jgi:hypothetical protein
MESNKLTGKLARWASLLQEYDFEVVHPAWITNLDANGFSRNPNPSDEDMTRTRWYEDYDRDAVPSWHAVAYLTLFFGPTIEVPNQGSDDENDRPQTIVDMWEDPLELHNLQEGTFPMSILAMERDRIGHQIKGFCWENALLF